jgi:hypothetical protein
MGAVISISAGRRQGVARAADVGRLAFEPRSRPQITPPVRGGGWGRKERCPTLRCAMRSMGARE